MKTSFLRFFAVAAALFAAVSAIAGPTVISGGTFNSTYVINKPGTYVLGGNRVLSDGTKHIVEITAPDVTLDLGGFSLSHPPGGAGIGFGIHIPATENVEIRNGSIVNAADVGVAGLTGKGLRVINVRVMSADGIGILSMASGTQVDRCNVGDARSIGIALVEPASIISDSVVTDCGDAGIKVLDHGRVLRTTVKGGGEGIVLSLNSSAIDCSVTGTTVRGINAGIYSTIRNVEVMANPVGVHSVNTTVVIQDSRIGNNTKNTQGTYTSGGGNVLQ